MMPVTTEQEPTTIEKLLDGFDDLILYRYPHVVGPPFVALLALGLAQAAYLGGPTAATVLAGVTVVVWILASDSAARLPGRREKLYAGACWLCGGLWTVAAAYLGPVTGALPWVPLTVYSHPVPPLLGIWGALLALAWPPWTKHRRVRRSVAVSAEILAWNGDAVGLPEVRLSTAGAKADAGGWQAPLVPDTPGKWTTDKLRKAIPNIASHYGAAIHEFSIDRVRGDKEGKWLLRYRKAEKREPIVYQPPTERPSARRPFLIGHVTSDPTQELRAEVWREGHGGVDSLVVGTKGYGKTVLLQRVALHAIVSKDGLLFIGDMKPGSQDYTFVSKRDLSPGIGARGAYLYCTTAAEIDAMILVLLALCGVRGRRPRRSRKVIFVLLDEMALYFEPTPPAGPTAAHRAQAYRIDMQRLSNFQKLANISRAYDIAIWEAVQKGKEKNTGGDARSAISAGQVVAFHAPKASDGLLVSNDLAMDPTKLPKGVAGQCLLSNGLHPEVVRGTLWNVTGETIRDVLDRFADVQDGLDEDELHALREEFGDAWNELRMANRASVEQPADEGEPEPEAEQSAPEPTPAPQNRAMTADESRQVVWDALATFDKPASVRDVAQRVGKSEQLTRARLNELYTHGRASRQGTGRWIKYVAVRERKSA
jgi:hypothetical protein